MKIAAKLIEKIDANHNIEHLVSDSLFNGKLGMVYYYFMLYDFFNEELLLDKIQYYLEEVFKNIEDQNSSILLDSTLENGLSGLGYMLSLLINKDVLDHQFKSQIEEINDVVTNDAIHLILADNYDYMQGPFGMLHYLNQVKSVDNINKIIDILMQKFDENSDFFFYNNTDYIEGSHIGYAHGICGIIKVLSHIENDKVEFIVENLLSKLVELIKNNEFHINGKRYYLPRSIYNKKDKKLFLNYRAVLAWSNSDINFSTLIYSLPEKFINHDLLNIADEIIEGSLHKTEEEETRVWDHRFYFGSSGLLKSYHYMYKKTNNEQYKNAAKTWYKKTINLLHANNIQDFHELNFLNNLPATTLSLLEYEEDIELNWSNLLLL